MAVIIRNLGGDMLGICEYEVRINDQRITTFRHNRVDGLTVCLQKAATACESHKWNTIYDQTMKQLEGIPFGSLDK